MGGSKSKPDITKTTSYSSSWAPTIRGILDRTAYSSPMQRETSDIGTTGHSRQWETSGTGTIGQSRQWETRGTGPLQIKTQKEKLLTDRPWRQPEELSYKFTAYSQKTLLNNFILRDTMGIEPNDGAGFHVQDFMYLVKGHIMNKYKFNPASPITPSDANYRETPEPMDVIHCVIFVISAVDVYNDIPEMYVRKIGQLQDNLRMEQIPRILVLTKIDLLCEQVQEDITNIFRSTKVRKVVKTASEVFHIDQASIHPVVNYEVTSTLTPEQNIPLLLALEQSMVYADGRVQQTKDDEEIR